MLETIYKADLVQKCSLRPFDYSCFKKGTWNKSPIYESDLNKTLLDELNSHMIPNNYSLEQDIRTDENIFVNVETYQKYNVKIKLVVVGKSRDGYQETFRNKTYYGNGYSSTALSYIIIEIDDKIVTKIYYDNSISDYHIDIDQYRMYDYVIHVCNS